MEREKFNAAAHKYRAFISYSRADRELVDDLYKRLTKWRRLARVDHGGALAAFA